MIEFYSILILMKDYGLEGLEQMEQVWFICRFLYLGTTIKLWIYWMYFTISVSSVISEKNYCDKKLFHLF